jgi:large subunit ribosomal protein L24
MLKIKKGDTVLVVKGKDKGKKGKVLRTFPREMKILVEGVNLVKKHQRPRREGEKGKIVEISKPIFISKVKLICPKCSKPTRVGFKIEKNQKFRFCKKCKNIID